MHAALQDAATDIDDTMSTSTTNDATLRMAQRADEEAVTTLLAASSLPLDGVHDALPGFVVAEHGGSVVGVAGIEVCGSTGEFALLRSVAVTPAWQSRGLGRALVSRAIAVAAARGVKALYLLTTTAEGWFPAFGFAVTPREAVPADIRASAEFMEACSASATVMVRVIGTPAN